MRTGSFWRLARGSRRTRAAGIQIARTRTFCCRPASASPRPRSCCWRDGMKSTTASSSTSRRRRWRRRRWQKRAASRARAHRGGGSGQAREIGARGGAPAPGGNSKARTAGARGRAPKFGSSGGHAARSTHADGGGHRAYSGNRGGGRRIRRIPRSAGGDTAGRTGRGKRRPGPQRGDAGEICGDAGASRRDRSTRSEKRGSAQSIALAVVSLAADCRERRDRGRNPIGAGRAADQHVVARPAVSARSGGGALQSALRAPANHGPPP